MDDSGSDRRRRVGQVEDPSTPLTHALFELEAEEGEDYPAEGATVYWGWRCTQPTYPLETGEQELTFGRSSVGNYLYADAGIYYEEGSVVLADQVAGRWYIRGLIREPQEDE